MPHHQPSLTIYEQSLLTLLSLAPNDNHKTATLRAFVLIMNGADHNTFPVVITRLRGAGYITSNVSGRCYRITQYGYERCQAGCF